MIKHTGTAMGGRDYDDDSCLEWSSVTKCPTGQTCSDGNCIEKPDPTGMIIIDHRSVDLYDDIPDQYIDRIKGKLINIHGESHSSGYLQGLALLAQQNTKYVSQSTEDEATGAKVRSSYITTTAPDDEMLLLAARGKGEGGKEGSVPCILQQLEAKVKIIIIKEAHDK